MGKVDSKSGLVILRADKSVNDKQVNDELRSIWELLRENEDLRKQVLEAGMDLDRCPFVAKRSEGQFGIAETILIAVASGLAKDAAKGLWDRVIWPRLSRRFGAGLEPQTGAPSR